MDDPVIVLYRSIEALIGAFQRNPFNFLYEADLRGTLLHLLTLAFGDTSDIEMRGGYHDSAAYGGNMIIRTTPAKSEYPTGEGLERFDVAIIDRGAVRHYDQAFWEARRFKNDAFWNQPVRAAVELKYCQLGQGLPSQCEATNDDAEKLWSYLGKAEREHRRFLGVAMLFVQSSKTLDTIPFSNQEDRIERDPQEGIVKYLATPSECYRFTHSKLRGFGAVPPGGGTVTTF
jgi:hypothetical protein